MVQPLFFVVNPIAGRGAYSIPSYSNPGDSLTGIAIEAVKIRTPSN